MKLVSLLTCAAGLAVGVISVPAFASVAVTDKADNYNPTPGNWGTGTNGVPGGSTWTNAWYQQSDGNAGPFLGGAGSGDLNAIKSPNFAWASYANGGGVQRFVNSRRFQGDIFNSEAMVSGQTFTVYQENGGIQSTGLGGQNNGFVGVSLGSGSIADPALLNPFTGGNTGAINGHQFLFGFLGGSSNYFFWDSSGAAHDTGIGWTDSGVKLEFTLNNAFYGNYTAKLTRLSDNATDTFGGTINGSLDRVSLHNYDAEWNDQFWNTVAVVPAPSSMALLGLGGLLAARRRR